MAHDTLLVKLSEDAFEGDAQFTIDIDGKPIGEPTSVQALHSSGDVETFTYLGNFGAGPHTVSVNFINDAFGGTADTDRNLYVEGITYDGTDYAGQTAANTGAGPDTDPNAAEVFSNGTVTFTNVAEGTPTAGDYSFTETSGNTTIADFQPGPGGDVAIFDDYPEFSSPYLFDELYQRLVDVPGVGTQVTFPDGNTTQTITFDGISRDDLTPDNFGFFVPTDSHLPGGLGVFNAENGTEGPDTLVVHVSEDAFQGDAIMRVTIDGHQISGPVDVTTAHSSGGFEDVTLSGAFGAGPHTVDVSFVNDAYGGTPDTDRNLYVGGITYDGQDYAGQTAANSGAGPDTDPNAAEVFSNGTVTFDNVGGTVSPGSDTLVVEASSGGDVGMEVAVDGKDLTAGGHAAWGEFLLSSGDHSYSFSGDFGPGPHTVYLTFDSLTGPGLPSGFGEYTFEGLDLNGQHFDASAAETDSRGDFIFQNIAGGSSPPPPPSTGPDSLAVYVAGEFSGFSVSVDGVVLSGPYAKTENGATQIPRETADGQIDAFTFAGDFGAGPHTVDVKYVPIVGEGIPQSSFTLYGIDLNGQHYNANAAEDDIPGGTAGPDGISASNDSGGDVIFHNVAEGTPTLNVSLNGGSGGDTLYGGPGNDTITGGAGHDTLTGSTGRDTFVETAGDGNDIIGFQSGTGGDVVDLVGYGYTSFADVMAHMTATNAGAQLTNPNGETITFFADNTITGGSPAPTPDTFTADNFVLSNPSSPPGPDTLVLHLSEDAYNGDAQFAVLVDGTQIGGPTSVTTLHSSGTFQDFTYTGHFGTGPHSVEVDFLNDAWGGSPDTDRNLYVQGITFNGTNYAGNTATDNAANGHAGDDPNAAVMDVNGSAVFSNVGGSSPPPPPETSTVTLHVSEDAFQGDAQFLVFVDGVQQGGTQTATASHSAGQVQDITFTGDYGAQGPGTVDIQFLNDAYGGSPSTDRNLYVQGLDVNGVHFAGNTALDNAANGHAADDPSAAVMDVNGTAEFQINHTAPPPDFSM